MTMTSQAKAGTIRRRPAGQRGLLTMALLAAMLSLGGCSTVSDAVSWANPVKWFEDDDPAALPQAAKPTATATDERFPNLGRVPPRPVEQSSSAERRQAIGNLTADRANARYTDEELRARPATGMQASAPPAAPVTQLPAATARAAGLPPLQGGAVPAQQVQQMAAGQGDPIGQRAVGAMGQAGIPQPMPQTPGYQPGPAYQAPGYAPNQAAAQAQNMGAVYAANLMASSATTLPPGLGQVQMQAPGSQMAAGPAPAPLTPGVNAPAYAAPGYAAPGYAAAAPAPAMPSRQLLAVVRFANGSATLDARDRNLLKEVVEYQKGTGGKGRLRVVGISSASSEPADIASKRAQNVGVELQKLRLDSRLMALEARAEGAPAYYQAAAATAEQSRRVEIYLEN